MKTDILQQLKYIHSSLETIASNGKISFYSVVVQILIAGLGGVIGTYVGSRLTMSQFKKQENIKIKEELRLTFYKQYEQLYKVVLDRFKEYKNEYQKILEYCLFVDEEGKVRFILNAEDRTSIISSKEDVKKNYDSLKSSIEIFEDMHIEFNTLYDFITNKEQMTKYNTAKLEAIKNKIDIYSTRYRDLKEAYMSLFNDSLEIESKINDIDDIREKFKKVDIKTYKKNLREIYKQNDKLDLLISDIQSINKEIYQDIIGKYFDEGV